MSCQRYNTDFIQFFNWNITDIIELLLIFRLCGDIIARQRATEKTVMYVGFFFAIELIIMEKTQSL